MELSLSFFRETPNKLLFIELSQNFCDWLQVDKTNSLDFMELPKQNVKD